MRFKLVYVAQTDKGLVREINEDSFLTRAPLFAVADGMGGHRSGELASKVALREFARYLKRRKLITKATLSKAFQQANRAVFDRAQEDKNHQGMGTTLTAVMIKNRKLLVGHVGDSRLYLFRKGELSQLTEDHSLVTQLVNQGKIKPEEANQHPQRNLITKAVGANNKLEPDIFSFSLKKGDRILLCTDGLTSMVSKAEIASIMTTLNLKEVAANLVRASNQHGGEDNITVVLLEAVKSKENGNFFTFTLLKIWLLLTVLTLGILLFLFINFSSNLYFLGLDGSKVAVYQGIPFNLAGRPLYHLVKTTNINTQQLPSYFQRRLEKGLLVKGKSEINPILVDLRKFNH